MGELFIVRYGLYELCVVFLHPLRIPFVPDQVVFLWFLLET